MFSYITFSVCSYFERKVLFCCCSLIIQTFLYLGALFFSTGTIRQGSCTCLCIALKKTALIYEINRTKVRYRKSKVGLGILFFQEKGAITLVLILHFAA